ncbi:hypothetical protein NRB16_26210 [Pseudomonas sp. LJDD11]|uniref:hypothetical protein n=1 Tax=unclassified Pseudomonas TaxID=196821 RepID=UPI002097F6A8|nr:MULTISPECIES: hypothetical protein [unclassified Pseudomonas]MCO8162020.1 hypothetical protein [Pseudomonas sp. 21LCFQ010]MCQ9427012.1 hypothetical protein [Pseudomonas sp. LJDD11]
MSLHPKPGAVLFGKDLPRLARFYSQLANLSITLEENRLMVLESDSFQLVLHALPPAVAKKLVIDSPPKLRTDLPLKLVLPVASLALARQQASELGGGLNPLDQQWQARNFSACDGFDPEGNVLQFREDAPAQN